MCVFRLHLYSHFILNIPIFGFTEIGQRIIIIIIIVIGMENSFRGLIYNFVFCFIIYKALYTLSFDLIITNELGYY